MTKLKLKMVIFFAVFLAACQTEPLEGANGVEQPVPTSTSAESVEATATAIPATAVPTQTVTMVPATAVSTQTATMVPATAVPTATTTPEPTTNPAFNTQFKFTDHGLAFPIGEPGSFEETWVYAPEAIYHDGLFHLFYTGGSGGSSFAFPTAIGYATSTDGITFERYAQNPILETPAESTTDLHVPVVTVLADGTWVMYLDEKDNSTFQSNTVRRATAPAPEGPWTLEDAPIYQAETNDWNQKLIPQNVTRTDNDYLLLFEARTQGTSAPVIGALISADGLQFMSHDDPATSEGDLAGADPILVGSGESNSWNQGGVGSPMIFQQDGGYGLFYLGDGPRRALNGEGVSLKLGYAFSKDGVHWEEHPANPLFEILGQSGRPYLGSAQLSNDKFFIYYSIQGGANGIGVVSVERTD